MHKLLNINVLLSFFLLTSSASVNAGGVDPNAATNAVATITGSITYRERIALPADAVVRVQLRDVSLMDVAAKLIGEQIIRPQHSVPIPFVVSFDPAIINERMSYSIFATIHSGERMLFVSDRNYPVLTRGNTNQIDLVLKMIQP